MSEQELHLAIDGEDFTPECEEITFKAPRLVYEEDNGRSVRRFLGPAGFQITLINPTPKAQGLIDGGRTARQVKLTTAGLSLTHSTHFIEEWTSADGTRKVFGRMAWDSDRDAKWIEELPAGASAEASEGK